MHKRIDKKKNWYQDKTTKMLSTYKGLSTSASKLYERILIWVSAASTDLSLSTCKPTTRTPSHDSRIFPSKSLRNCEKMR